MAEPGPAPGEHDLVLFDGECNLCNRWVRFIIRRDRRGVFRFASLGSPASNRALAAAGTRPESVPTTVILIRSGKVYTKTDAVYRILGRLRWPWPIAAVGLVLPRFLRDPIYSLVARNRYRWFGRSEQCMMPTPENRARFLS